MQLSCSVGPSAQITENPTYVLVAHPGHSRTGKVVAGAGCGWFGGGTRQGPSRAEGWFRDGLGLSLGSSSTYQDPSSFSWPNPTSWGCNPHLPGSKQGIGFDSETPWTYAS